MSSRSTCPLLVAHNTRIWRKLPFLVSQNQSKWLSRLESRICCRNGQSRLGSAPSAELFCASCTVCRRCGVDFQGQVKCMYGHHILVYSRVWINRVRLPILLYSWSAGQGKWAFPCPRYRLRIWSRETGSGVPFSVSLLILHTQAKSVNSAYSRDSFRFPHYTIGCDAIVSSFHYNISHQ